MDSIKQKENFMKHICIIVICVGCLLFQNARAQLFQEGFGYTSGSTLGGNGGWAGGANSTLSIGSANLTYPGLNDLGGNDLVLTSGGTTTSDTNFFSATPITSGNVFYSFLIDCTSLPTANNYLTSLDPAGSSPNGSTDALAVYAGVQGSGWKIGVRTTGGGSGAIYATNGVSTISLSLNTVYFMVVEYSFGSPNNTVSLYFDPVPGGSQSTANAVQTSTTTPSGIGDVGFKAQSSTQGNFIFDNLLIGTSWADVTPVATPEPSVLALSGLGVLGMAWRFRRARR
jgi:hypothetical protein